MNEAVRAWLAAWFDPVRTLVRLAAGPADLFVRLSLAQAIFVSGMTAGHHAMLVVTLVLGPALLAAGLLVRPAALALLALSLMMPTDVRPHDISVRAVVPMLQRRASPRARCRSPRAPSLPDSGSRMSSDRRGG